MIRFVMLRCTVVLVAMLFLPALLARAEEPQVGKTLRYDVVIAGAGTGGTSAAIEAARLGARVALLEESDWIGGQMSSAGVGSMDEGVGPKSTPPSGFYEEYLERVRKYYDGLGKTMGTCYWRAISHCFDPATSQQILKEMIADVNAGEGNPPAGHIDLYLRDRVVHVSSTGDTVTGVKTSQGETFSSKVLIDATEYGDVLPLTPARYRMGYTLGKDDGKSCTQAITWAASIKKYSNGVPENLLMHTPPPGYEKWLPTFERSMRSDGNPASRDLPVSFVQYVAYRAEPDLSNPEPYTGLEPTKITRSSMNWFNDFDVNTSIFDRDKRKKIICDAKLKTLANIYYFQQVMGEKLWSVANDEGFDTKYNQENTCANIPAEYKEIERNMPQHPYIRESIRLVGEYTLTGGDIRRESEWAKSVNGFTDAIAVGDYADDLHSCNSNPKFFEQDLEHITDLPSGFRFGPFQVPLRSLIPEKVDGLLAAEKNISQSRLANGATRLQPITMMTGEAAGALAGLAVADHVQPREVSSDAVQVALLRGKVILAREHMLDLTVGSKLWQAAQFAVVHQWITMQDDKWFKPELPVTRIGGARPLKGAFLGKADAGASATNTTGGFDVVPQTLTQVYADVPLYSKNFNVVSSIHEAGAVPVCQKSPEKFCANEPITLGEFLHSAELLSGRSHGGHIAEAVLRADVTGKDDEPLTRGDAAIILYNSAVARVQRENHPNAAAHSLAQSSK